MKGRVIIQTFNPAHPAILFAKSHDVVGFSLSELAERKQTWQPVKQELTGWLARYQKLVSNASQGGILGS